MWGAGARACVREGRAPRVRGVGGMSTDNIKPLTAASRWSVVSRVSSVPTVVSTLHTRLSASKYVSSDNNARTTIDKSHC